MQKTRTYRDPLDPGQVVRQRNQWVSDQTYQEMVQKVTIPCTDTILTLSGEKAIYLGKRTALPMAGIWCLGGRIWFNDESLEDSISRCLTLETGVTIAPARFEMLPTPHLYSWVKVQQGDFGGKNLALTFKLEITQEELEKMAKGLQPKEYDKDFGLQRFTRERLIDERVHPAMLDLFDEIHPQ
jgi:hypothetical protein